MEKRDMILRLAGDFNQYSRLAALNYVNMKEGKCDESTLQWNRGHMYCVEDYLKALADDMGAELVWECREHIFGYDDWQRQLEYRTVRAVFDKQEPLCQAQRMMDGGSGAEPASRKGGNMTLKDFLKVLAAGRSRKYGSAQ